MNYSQQNPKTAHYANINPCKNIAKNFRLILLDGVGLIKEVGLAARLRSVMTTSGHNNPGRGNTKNSSSNNRMQADVASKKYWFILYH
jgi:hypothetical protein